MLAAFAVLEKGASHSFVSRNVKSSDSTGTSWAILTRNKPSKGFKEALLVKCNWFNKFVTERLLHAKSTAAWVATLEVPSRNSIQWD